MKFHEKLRLWCLDKFGSLKDAAIQLNVKPPDLSKYVKGNIKPGLNFLQRVHDLGGDINWMLTDEVNPPLPAAGTVEESRSKYAKNEIPKGFIDLLNILKEDDFPGEWTEVHFWKYLALHPELLDKIKGLNSDEK